MRWRGDMNRQAIRERNENKTIKTYTLSYKGNSIQYLKLS
jgi:hypothetical protein